MNLPRDIARCDGILPKKTLLNGKEGLLWSIDCPKRETCARYCQFAHRDTEETTNYTPFVAHFHAPSETCPDYIHES